MNNEIANGFNPNPTEWVEAWGAVERRGDRDTLVARSVTLSRPISLCWWRDFKNFLGLFFLKV